MSRPTERRRDVAVAEIPNRGKLFTNRRSRPAGKYESTRGAAAAVYFSGLERFGLVYYSRYGRVESIE